MKTGNWKSWLLASSILGIAAPLPALAQNVDDPTTIIVTARRTEERLQDVPISITVFNQQQLSKANIVNSQDLARITPSLSANSNFGSENSSFALRGFVQDNGTAPSVGVYFADVVAPRGASNGIPTGDGAGPGSFFDLANVQVLKGPQGTLQGRNTTGGAVLLVPQKPTGKFEGYVEGSIGNYDMRRIQAVVNVPVLDTLRIRLGVDRQTRDGYLHNVSGMGPTDFNDVDYTVVRASVVADLTPNLENYTIVNYSNSNTTGSVQKLVAADGTNGLGALAAGQRLVGARDGFYDVRQDMLNPYSKLEQWQVINTTTWRASDTLTIKNIISYSQLKDKLNNPLFGTAFGNVNPATNVNFSSIVPLPGGYSANESTFTEEFQIQGRTANDKLTYQGGVYFENAQPLSDVGSQSPVVLNCSNSATLTCSDYLGAPGHPAGAVNLTAGRTAFRDIGVYGQATYKINDQFKVTGGIRYTWDREINDSQQITYTAFPNYPTQGPPGFAGCTNPDAGADCRIHFELKSEKPTWLIDLDYTPTQDILIYAKYARGYRSGVIAPNVSQPFNYVQPEKVDSYEVGAKTSFTGMVRGTLNVAAFYNDFSNQQLQLGFNARPGVPVSPTAAPINAGKSRIWGVEVEGSLRPFEGLDISGGYTYLNTKIQQVDTITVPATSPYIPAGQQRPGDPLALTPKNKFTITGTYTLPLDESIGRISFGATFTHTDSQLANYDDRVYQGTAFSSAADIAAIRSLSYLQPTNLLNANIGWNGVAGTHADISLFATNLTKQKYYAYVPGLASGTGFETAVIGEPRMYGVRLKYRFGS
ncbi:MAG TPA: TonB-dependent receptor [Sphingobium sp.]|uniref:TonB-dependent receptor n=1 Tax=Sphingobium sp. TaxID=1912891 RepID=UPI002ED05EA0